MIHAPDLALLVCVSLGLAFRASLFGSRTSVLAKCTGNGIQEMRLGRGAQLTLRAASPHPHDSTPHPSNSNPHPSPSPTPKPKHTREGYALQYTSRKKGGEQRAIPWATVRAVRRGDPAKFELVTSQQ